MQIRQELADNWGISLADYLAVHKKFEPGLAEGKVDESDVEAEFVRQFNLALPKGFFFNCDWVDKFQPILEMHKLAFDLAPYYRLGLLTNVTRRVWEKAQTISGMYPKVNFELKIKSFEVGLAKPDPKIYALAIKQTGLKPEEVLLIDDLEPNIRSARTVGMQGFKYDPDHVMKKTAQLRKLLLAEAVEQQ
jgi:putative hydrolase of the HAD superfamily